MNPSTHAFALATAPPALAAAPAAFTGVWRVREHVYTPGGLLVGTVRQRRRVEPAGEGRLRVLQDNEPDAALAHHELARFAGHHEFELSIDGPYRRYHGPAVVGGGLAIGDGAMLGRGVWPALGWSFRSYAVTVAPGLQLTGGEFHRGGVPLATIAGLGVAATAGDDDDATETWPALDGPAWPGDVARVWRGRRCRVSPAGLVLSERELIRRYQEQGSWLDEDDEAWSPVLRLGHGAWEVHGRGPGGLPLAGTARLHGGSLAFEVTCGPDVVLEEHETLDARRGHLVAFRRRFRRQVLEHIDVIRLRPA